MKFARLIGQTLGLVATIGIAGCGGGSSNGGATPPAPTPATPTAVTAVGTITGFGSVYVNGAKYEVENTTIIAIEDEPEITGDDSRLLLGMKVVVTATELNGLRTAQKFEFDEDLKGPIESITPDPNDPTIGTFAVMSQTVTVDAGTVFDDDIGDNDGVPGIDFRDLQVGMVVEVSGFPTDTGYLATRVDRELDGVGGNPNVGDPAIDGDELEMKGFVTSIAADFMSITVEGVPFILGPGIIFEDGLLPNEDLVGVFVEVKADIVGPDFVAIRIEREDDFDDDGVGEFEIEGVLQSVNTIDTPNTFTINGVTVPVTDASSLVPFVGKRVEIEGTFNASQVLVLHEVKEEIEDNVRTEDLVESVDPGAVSFTTRLGLTISPTGDSQVQDDVADDGDHLTPEEFIGRLLEGDRIESRGHENVNGSVTWTRVERDESAADNNDFDCELRGPVTSITGDASSFTFDIQGVTVSTTNVADNNFEGENGAILGRDAFFGALSEGKIVEATSFEGDSNCQTGALEAREVELESADDD
jgi:hypothetical protein